MSPALTTFLFESANFIALAVLLGWFFFKPVRQALQKERERHAELERQAEETAAKARQLEQETTEAKRRLSKELDKQRAEHLAEERARLSQLQADAERRQVTLAAQAEKRLQAAERLRAKELATSVGQIAAQAVRDLLQRLNGPALDAALVRSACEHFSQGQFADGVALVEHARPLDDESRRLLSEALGHYRERQLPELGAGVRITTDAGQVDASALSLARHAANVVTERMGPQHDSSAGDDDGE